MQGKLDEAIAAYNDAIAKDPKNARAYAHWGKILVVRNQAAEGLAKIQKGIELDPNSGETYAPAYGCLAEALADAGQLEKAVDAGKKAVQLDGKDADVRRSYGYTLQSAGNFKAAEDEYRTAIDLAPRLSYLRLTLAGLYRRLDRSDEAGIEFQK